MRARPYKCSRNGAPIQSNTIQDDGDYTQASTTYIFTYTVVYG